ncbi:unnamed protein product [Calypogeia fissa]
MGGFFGKKEKDSSIDLEVCSQVPSLVSMFVDTFVDYVVGGQFLGPLPSDVQNSSTKQEPVFTVYPAADRLIAIGDFHGDLNKAKEALFIAEVMDHKEKWIGGKTVVVQVGDLLDRGGDELKIIYLLEKLKIEAQRVGGEVHIMNGNHEIMNVGGDFRYVTPEGLDEFKHWADWYKMGNVLKERCKGLEKPYDFFKDMPAKNMTDRSKARFAALRPGGPITSRFLARHPVVLAVGGNVFVHGGLMQKHVDYGISKINREAREWMEGKLKFRAPKLIRGSKSPVWLRTFSVEEENMVNCSTLNKVLSKIPGAKRMVMGHTVQLSGVNGVCKNRAVRVDVGMSRGCGDGPPEVLEIRNDDEMTVLTGSSPEDLTDDMSQLTGRNSGIANLLTPQGPPIRVPVNFQTSPNFEIF